MAAEYTFDGIMVLAKGARVPAAGAVGKFTDLEGNESPTYDTHGAPAPLRADAFGQVLAADMVGFKADIPQGFVDFGGGLRRSVRALEVPITAEEAQRVADSTAASTRDELMATYPTRSEVAEALTGDPVAVTDLTVDEVLADPTSKANARLSSTYVPRAEAVVPLPAQAMSFAKSGVIGTAGKVPVALRFDDWQDAFKANVWPLLVARRMPASMALISRRGSNPWFTTTTWADIVEWNKNGLEIWNHGPDHQPPAQTYAALYEHVVTSKAELGAQGLPVVGWAMPGVPAPSGYGSNLQFFPDWNSDAGRLIQAHYALSETDLTGPYRQLPSQMRHGLGHVTCSDGRTTATPTIQNIDHAVRYGLGLEIMCHAGNLDKAGHLPLAEFVVLLDYLVTLRDTGKIEIVTPSSLVFADPGSSRRMNLIVNGGFEDPIGTGQPYDGYWQNIDGAERAVVEVPDAPGGVTGKVLRVSGFSTFVTQNPINLKTRGLAGMTLMMEADCRAYGGASSTARVLIQDTQNTSRLSIDHRPVVPNVWTKVRVPFTPRPDTDQLTIGLNRLTGNVEWDNVRVIVA